MTNSFGANFNQSSQVGFRYGPNLMWSLSANAPFVWGQWLPQAYGSLYYTWLEPLDTIHYGDKLGRAPTYWRMEAAVELTPFYGGYLAGLGIRPIRSNLQLEFNIVYESYLYFKSNLEMVTADVEGGGKISETWNADYIVDNVFDKDAKFDYAQLVDISTNVSYAFSGGSILGMKIHYILSDISTDFEGKSYDYRRNIPVFSRDFLVESEIYGRLPISEHLALLFQTDFYATAFLREGNTVKKESLSYGKALVGTHISWNDGLQNLIFELGGWNRVDKNFYNGSLAQQFLFQFEYQGYLSFPFHRNK